MTRVERANGYIEDMELDGSTVLTVTVQGVHPTDEAFLDRVLQFVLMEMGIDNTWKETTPPPTNPEEVPAGDPVSFSPPPPTEIPNPQ